MARQAKSSLPKAQQIMLHAATLIDQAQAELRRAAELVVSDPDYRPRQPGEPYTLATWIVEGINATLAESDNLDNAAQLIRADALPGSAERRLDEHNTRERREAKRRAA